MVLLLPQSFSPFLVSPLPPRILSCRCDSYEALSRLILVEMLVEITFSNLRTLRRSDRLAAVS